MRAATKENAGRAPGDLPDSVQQRAQSVPQTAMVGKALAVWLYCIEARTLSATRFTFARHPEWASA